MPTRLRYAMSLLQREAEDKNQNKQSRKNTKYKIGPIQEVRG